MDRLWGAGIIGAGALAAISTGIFFQSVYGVSVDDAYIFFVYARNLAEGNGWSFNPGETSFGTSSVLWTLILAVTASFKTDLIQSSRILSCIFHALSTVAVMLILRRLTQCTWISILAGAALATSSSLVLIAVTGMDVSVHILTLLVLVLAFQRWGISRPILLGVLAGTAFLSRPDAVIAIPMLFSSWLIVELRRHRNLRYVISSSRRGWLRLGLAAFLTVLPWEIFLLVHTQRILPTTHYGKLLSMPGAPETLDYSLGEKVVVAFNYSAESLNWILTENGLFVSIILIIIAGVVVFSKWLLFGNENGQKPDNREFLNVATCLFLFLMFLGLPLEYGWKTPWWYGGYLHRYILPVLPFAIILSFYGIFFVFESIGLVRRDEHTTSTKSWSQAPRWAHLSSATALALTVGVVVVLFFKQLAPAVENYRTMVGFNEKYRRAVAEWIATNTPVDARIGECFLGTGAIGFYANRYFVECGGLIDDEIIDYWAMDGNPRSSGPETMEYFQAKGVTHLILSEGMGKSLGTAATEVARIENPKGDLSWSGHDFNQAFIYRYHP